MYTKLVVLFGRTDVVASAQDSLDNQSESHRVGESVMRRDASLRCALLADHLLVEVIPPFGDAQEDDAQNDVANVGEKVVEIRKIADEMVGIGAREIVVTQVLVARRRHHLLHGR